MRKQAKSRRGEYFRVNARASAAGRCAEHANLTGAQLATVAPFPFIIWGADELRHLLLRRYRARHGPQEPQPGTIQPAQAIRNTASERCPMPHTAFRR